LTLKSVEKFLRAARDIRPVALAIAIDAFRREVCNSLKFARHTCNRLAAVIADLDQGPDSHGNQEGNDQDWHGPPQSGFGNEQAPIRRLCN
ncbi:MAG: hypothetical protein ACXWJ5_00090, partial [Xanthobacteraceae bacterium]